MATQCKNCNNLGSIELDGFCEGCFEAAGFAPFKTTNYHSSCQTIMVPVVVSFNEDTKFIYAFIPPTKEDVRKALMGTGG